MSLTSLVYEVLDDGDQIWIDTGEEIVKEIYVSHSITDSGVKLETASGEYRVSGRNNHADDFGLQGDDEGISSIAEDFGVWGEDVEDKILGAYRNASLLSEATEGYDKIEVKAD